MCVPLLCSFCCHVLLLLNARKNEVEKDHTTGRLWHHGNEKEDEKLKIQMNMREKDPRYIISVLEDSTHLALFANSISLQGFTLA